MIREYVQELTSIYAGGFGPSSAEQWYRSTGEKSQNASVAWGTANLAVYMPIMIEQNHSLLTIAVHNGVTVSGNVAAAIYKPDAEGKPGALISAQYSAVPQSGTNLWQFIDSRYGSAPVIQLVRGLYYLAISFTSATATVFAVETLTTNGKGPWMGSVFTQAGVGTSFPAIATPSAAPVACVLPEALVF